MSTKNIYSALKSAIKNSGIGIHIVYPNTEYTRVIDTPYCEIFFIPIEPDAAELGRRKTERVSGILQIDIYYPAVKGDGALLDTVDLLKLAFGRGDDLTYGDSCVRIDGAYPIGSPGVEDDVWYKQIFQVDWNSYEFIG